VKPSYGTKPNWQHCVSDAIPYFIGVSAECEGHLSCVSETFTTCQPRDNILFLGEFLLYAARLSEVKRVTNMEGRAF